MVRSLIVVIVVAVVADRNARAIARFRAERGAKVTKRRIRDGESDARDARLRRR
jgi:hypothetical protein